MKTLTKKLLVQRVAKSLGTRPSRVCDAVGETLASIFSALAEGGRVELRDFGVFEVVVRKGKVGRNPQKPALAVPIPPTRVAKFTPSKKLKALLKTQSAQVASLP